ncbi:nuclear transport factor 2 family protein [Cumulibacter manganitolerans]|uniref:nuclear transport factor 2 family protein n=1 Tax=Cumulibacter manganitolerans TaxID=1884992 RepID=UPI001294AFE6|nr:nuclear transport factor 2 family protein [Cumulibacter manganitolerans]
MTPHAMDQLIEAHLAAENAGDLDAAVAVYTPDVEHDVVGNPDGANHGVAAARDFYGHLLSDIHTETMEPVRTLYGEDHCTIEHLWSGTVPGTFMGVPGNNRHISFRLLHIFEFRDGLISRENAWLDAGAIVQQLSAP